MSSTLNTDLYVNGSLSSKTFNAPAGSITKEDITPNAGIEATKVEHQFPVLYEQLPGTAILAETKLVHLVRGATGEIVGIEACIMTQASGADRTVSVDLHKADAATTPATVLTSPISITNTTVVRTAVTTSLSASDLVDGDILEIVVTVAGAAGTQAEGLLVTLFLREDAQ